MLNNKTPRMRGEKTSLTTPQITEEAPRQT